MTGPAAVRAPGGSSVRAALKAATRFVVASENVLLGGQAVLEGVMMRSPKAFAVAVRRPDGEIVYLGEQVPAWTARHRLLRMPVVRGVCTLFQSLGLGMRALNFSSDNAFPEEVAKAAARGDEKKGSGAAMWVSVALAVVLGIGLFFVLPLGLTELLKHLWPGLGGGVLYNLVEGLIRGAIFLAYIAAIGFAPDIKRLFRYHGAEHKVVHAYEAKGPMDVETVQRFSVLHPRCGTSFLLFVMVVSILVFSFIPGAWSPWAKGAVRILALPLVVGLSYELIRFSARRDNAFTRALVAPGLLLQRMTTAAPDDDMVRVALAAFQRTSELEGGTEPVVL